jgi:sugar phosphate isomerase/epimerase
MKLGLNSAILPELDFEEVFDFACENGFKQLEVMCWPKGKAERRYAGVTHIDMDEMDQDKAKYIKDYTIKTGVGISALGYFPNPLDPDMEKRIYYINHLKKVIVGASLLDVDTVTTFIGRDPKRNYSESFTDFENTWPDIIKFAEDSNVKIGIETCPMYESQDEWPGGKNLAASPKIWRDMFSAIDSDNFGLNYDPSHFIWQRMDYIKPMYEFSNKIFHCHIKDAKFFKDKYDDVGFFATPLEYHVPKIPGYGDINWSDFFCTLSEIRYNGCVAIEIEDYSFENSFEERRQAILQSQKFIQQWVL